MSRVGLYANPELARYRQGDSPVPPRHWLWPLYGAGLENLGVDDRPIQVDTPSCGPHQLLVRHDAVGLCFSDTKIIKAGNTHPRLAGRDMKANPVVMGHEVVLTVLEVGEDLAGRFERGDRFIVQADIRYKGVGLAYGYALQGGLSQYNLISEEILEGDEGCYLIRVKPDTGYAQAALTEPWACVVASYDIPYRTHWKSGGVTLIAAGRGAMPDHRLGSPYPEGQPPSRVVTMGVSGTLLDELRRAAKADGFDLVQLGAPDEVSLSRAVAESGQDGFDDIVFLGADPHLYELLEPTANSGCVLNLVGEGALSGSAQVDVGRLHYDGLSLVGTAQPVIGAAYKPIRTELRPGGCAAFIGAAGPMGQMHVQRALQAKEGPRLIVATDLVPERLAVLETKLALLIQAKRGTTELICRTPDGRSPREFNASLVEDTGGVGFDDIVVLAPSGRVVAESVGMLARNGVMNIFAGLPRGTRVPIELSNLVTRGIRFTGSSGSGISDLRNMLDAAESGLLDPNLSVVAVAGLCGAKEGLEGIISRRFPGKCVIYPQILDFPVTMLEDLRDALPDVHAKLGPHHSWTNEAEAEFLRELLP
ncbi:MAG: hypothetical protein E3J25_08855 [Anaerolineales bacterium]|nr:MAG: hypothetical protein E3J25_08855 [Anaerolineales bacterium]